MTLVLFATEYDSAHIVANVLSKSVSEHCVFPLLVKHHASNLVYFCLQTQKCTDSQRVAPVFVVNNDVLNLAHYLHTHQPIPLSALVDSLNEEETKPIYNHLFRTVISPEHGGEVREFKHLVYFHHSAIVRYLNLIFLCPTSPSWFISVFGHTEGQVLLTMSYYLLERQYSTIPTVEEYVRSFSRDLGVIIPTHATMTEFTRMLLGSPFRSRIPQFVQYAMARNQRDYEELVHVDRQINTFREQARLPDTVCVHYIYLSYRTALSRSRLIKYREVVAYDEGAREEQCRQKPLFLGRHLADDLLSVMDKYFSLPNFLQDYIETRILSTDNYDLRLSGYSHQTTGPALTGFFGTSSQVMRKLDTINSMSDSVFPVLERSLSGLLRLCASLKTANTYATGSLAQYSQRQFLIPKETRFDGPIPLFRVQLPNDHHVFCAITCENWHQNLFPSDLLKHVPDTEFTDEALTDMIWLHDDDVASSNAETQFYYTRHEIFNERLPTYNFIADFDLRLRDGVTGLSKEVLFEICRGLRRVWVTVWQSLFGNMNPDYHPVYFFKSACKNLTPDFYDDDNPPPSYETRTDYCKCSEKLGLRIICPFPERTLVIRPSVLRSIAQVLNHAICLDTLLHQHLDPISHPESSLDTGIYHHGRSVRLPFMYKMDQEDGYFMYRRLLPIFIVPEGFREHPLGFVRAQLDIRNLLHHHAPHYPPGSPRPPVSYSSSSSLSPDDHPSMSFSCTRIILGVRDKLCPSPDINFMETRSVNVTRYEKRTLSDVIGYHLRGEVSGRPDSDPASDLNDLQRLVVTRVWPLLLENLTQHYEPKVSEQFVPPHTLTFKPHSPHCVSVKRLEGSRTKDFRCLNYTHRNPQETVQVFIDLRTEHSYALWASLWSRCFTKKCHSNAKNVHISVKLRPPTNDQ
ncbi:helicase-primase primase subunit [macacine betaherpesvirus 3]|nr:Rh100 [macacine betaherpesvirus 3]QMS44019.1 Rh100 [synthetic construct]QQL10393.1 Rh100 [macacine betaherpesvirus 3]QQL10572.1 Rh100 [Rhesus cytomegalovirus strain 68-1.2]QQL10754.1 Rh100 [Rhesus cytomegalovirus strain 68-1_FL]